MPVRDLPQRHGEAWAQATQHPFLAAVRDGTVARAAFDTWLVQDFHFVTDLLRCQARLLARAPRHAQAALAGGLVALVDELAWFEDLAATRDLDLGGTRLPGVAAYDALLARLEDEDVGTGLTALWTIERVYLDAWSFAAPGAVEYREFVAHWTTPEFAAYVEALGQAADEAAGPDGVDAVVADVLAAERAFWDMSVTASPAGTSSPAGTAPAAG